MSYLQYGIERELVERVKLKMKHPVMKERVKGILQGVTKADLQNRAKIRKLIAQISSVLKEPINERQAGKITDFVIAQNIDPNNTFHLIKLWGMFR